MTYKKIVLCLCGLISAFMLGACGSNEVKNSDIEVTESNVVEGYDILGGTWTVGAIYYKNRLINVHDVDGLEDLYDSIYLTFNEDGSFVYYSTYNRKGEYTKYDNDQSNSYLLKTTSLSKYDFENGELVEKEIESDSLKTYIITFLDEKDTIEFNEYDSVTGKSMEDGNQLVLVKGNTSEYIDNNKTVINSNNDKKEDNVNDNDKQTDDKRKNYTNSSLSNNTNISSGKKNALERALDYLDYSAFSYTGLIEQLEFEGFTNEEATYGADNCGANWNEQAVKKAEQYLDYTAFSYSGLVEQLEFEGFTHSQAEYGASQAY